MPPLPEDPNRPNRRPDNWRPNYRLVAFSAIVTALAGAMLGVAASKLGHRDFDRYRHEDGFYTALYNRYYALVGAGLGLAIGAGQECVRELNQQRQKEWRQQDRE